MKFRRTAIALGVGAATAVGLSLLKVDKPVVIGSTAVVFGAGLMISKKDGEELNTEDLIESGYKKLFDEKDFEGAIVDAQQLISINPKEFRGYLILGTSKIELEDYEGAMYAYNKSIELNSNNAKLYYNRGNIHKELDQEEEAVQDFNKAIAIDPTDSDFYHARGQVKITIESYQEAVEDCTKAIEINPKEPDYYFTRGRAQSKLGNHEIAIEDLNKAIQINPDDDEYYLIRGSCHYLSYNNEEAIVDYSKAIELDPEFVGAYYNRGIVRNEIDDFQGAIDDYSKVIESSPENEDAYIKRAHSKALLGDTKGMVSDYTKAIEINPNNDYYYFQRAVGKRDLADPKSARDDYTKAIEIESGNQEYYFHRATTNKLLVDYEGALNDYLKVIELDPESKNAKVSSVGLDGIKLHFFNAAGSGDKHAIEILKNKCYPDAQKLIELETSEIKNNSKNSEHLINRGLLKEKFDPLDAVNDFTKAIEIDPENANIYFFRGIVRSKLRDTQSAIDDLKRSIEIDPLNQGANEHLNFSNYLLGHKFYECENASELLEKILDQEKTINEDASNDTQKKFELCSEKIQLDPTNPIPYFDRACVKTDLGDIQGSIEDLTKAIELDKDFDSASIAYINRGLNKYDLGDFDGAISDYSQALERNAKLDIAAYYQGNAKRQLKDLKGAIACYTKAIEINPENCDAINNRGVTKKDLADFNGAIEDYQLVLKYNADYPLIFYNIGCAKSEEREDSAAIKYYDKEIEINPKYPYSYYNRGNAYQNLGDHQKAIDNYNTVLELIPDFALAYRNRGVSKKDLGDLKGACKDWSKSTLLGDGGSVELIEKYCASEGVVASESFYLERAEANKYDDPESAIKDLKQVLEFSPENTDALSLLGEILVEECRYAESIEHLDKAIKLDPEDATSYYDRANARRELEDYEGALNDAMKVYEINPDYQYPPISLNIASDYYQLGKYQDAINLMNKEMEREIDNDGECSTQEFYYERGRSKKALGDDNGGIKDIIKSKNMRLDYLNEYIYPERSNVENAYVERGHLKKELGDLKGACEDWKKAADLGDEDAAELLKEHCQ